MTGLVAVVVAGVVAVAVALVAVAVSGWMTALVVAVAALHGLVAVVAITTVVLVDGKCPTTTKLNQVRNVHAIHLISVFAPPAPMDQYPSYAEKSLPPEGSPYEKEYPHWSEQEVIDELEEPESIMQLQPMYQPMEEQPLIVLPPAEQPPAYVMAPGAPEPEQGCHCPVTCQNSCNSQCGDCCGYSSQTCISVDCC
eukprot:GHVO01045909.1.p2 GENE.GHVO01045909.1~~GHVO01045909.1.p2  ORF type:complete len:196 (-),score=38.13 GHVO01045909.1:84-671(-)